VVRVCTQTQRETVAATHRPADEGIIDGFSLLDIDPIMNDQAVKNILPDSRHKFGDYALDRLGSRVHLTDNDRTHTIVSTIETMKLIALPI
jgi:hypothetical protein